MADSNPNKVAFDLATPARLMASEEADMIVVPGADGDFGVLPGHTLLISRLRPGIVDVHNGGKVTERIFVEGGFAEATAERCTVLADAAVPVSEISADDASARLAKAKEAHAAADELTRFEAEVELRVSEALVAATFGHSTEKH